jgi:hypothetical protein
MLEPRTNAGKSGERRLRNGGRWRKILRVERRYQMKDQLVGVYKAIMIFVRVKIRLFDASASGFVGVTRHIQNVHQGNQVIHDK